MTLSGQIRKVAERDQMAGATAIPACRLGAGFREVGVEHGSTSVSDLAAMVGEHECVDIRGESQNRSGQRYLLVRAARCAYPLRPGHPWVR